MAYRAFKHHFHDGFIEGFALGPRRELTIDIVLDPVWNKQAPRSVSVRFGGIENYDEVAAFFNALPPPSRPDAYIDEIVGIVFTGEGSNFVLIDLATHGDISVRAQHVFEG